MEALGHQAASIGTIGVVSPAGDTYGSLTTPDPVELHRTLDRLARRRRHPSRASRPRPTASISTGSTGCASALASFTNLRRDHLDYHGTLEAYLPAKLILFQRLVPADGTAVIETDHEFATEVVDAARPRGLRVIAVGRMARRRRGHPRSPIAPAEGFAQI